MSYSSNPNLPKARATALQLLVRDQLQLHVVLTSAELSAPPIGAFAISMVQSDNGPEYGRYFEQVLRSYGMTTRHSILHRPNDNAHIERFNRTIQTECIGYYWRRGIPLKTQRSTVTTYLDYYNTKRVHLGIQMQVPTAILQRS